MRRSGLLPVDLSGPRNDFDPKSGRVIPVTARRRCAEAEFGFTATTGLRAGLERTVAWYREHGHG